ncbi:glycosyltransferase involved in cell wall biosynthesis [Sporomusaceae bacterium BoRhaA]|uniref:tetratricopeptide repeat-containing glycosyltransferase family 2 protein n=1 Tax=Pelorhabdus rhamnosifermentans TaxID=2772457 RepID=UPI001C062976|nr:glycosyltransferase [Pelorhabdus rhamnosifermentans]MBU2700875.1 glycosyltransferase involved in cell wall biosynthesis [Pelorhabdus rhamnosifermentans]
MSADIHVTLCMITKNEETNIACCIQSVKHLVDEIIVVDTGSDDSTMDQALQAGAKVFTFDWQYDFAEARNFGLERATGDWILVLDADETLEYIDIGKFSNVLRANPQIEGYFIHIESYIGQGEDKIDDQAVRLFRNRKEYHFQGAIHEQVAASIRTNNQGQGLAVTDLKIIHRGYLNETIQAKDKHFRNMEVINRALTDNPDNPFLRYGLAIEYIQQGKVGSGNQELIKALQHMTGGEGYFQNVVLTLVNGLLKVGERVQAKNLLNHVAVILPPKGEVGLLQGEIAFYDGDYQEAVQFFQQALTGIDDMKRLERVHQLCGDIYNSLADYEQAEREYFAALKLFPQHLYPLLQIIGIKQKGKSQLSWREISKFTTMENNKKLQLALIKQGEVQIALIVTLLNMINGNQEDQARLGPCDDYLQAVIHYQPVDELSQTVVDYLIMSAESAKLYARAGRFHCELLSVDASIDQIVYDNLELIIRTLCPIWVPSLTLKR